MSIKRLPDGRIQLNYVYTQEAQDELNKNPLPIIDEMEDMLIKAAKENKEKISDTTSN